MRPRVTLAVLPLAAGLLLLASGPAAADVHLRQLQHTDAYQVMGHSQPAQDDTIATWLAADRARMDHSTGTSTILRLDKNVVYVLNRAKHTYTESPFTAEPAVEDTTEEGRAAAALAHSMMGAVVGTMSATVTPTDETKKIGSWNCRKYLISMSMAMGSSESEAWACPDIHVSYGRYARLVNALLSHYEGFADVVAEMDKIKGMVVLQTATSHMMGAEVSSRTELLSVDDATPPAGTYDVPAGYTKAKS